MAAAGAASAAQLVEGGYLDEVLKSQPAEGDGPATSADLGGFTLSFTPRESLAFGSGHTATALADVPTLRLSLVPGDSERENLSYLNLAPGKVPGASVTSRLYSDSFEIGGALEWKGWSFGGTYTEFEELGGDTRMVGATLGYGRVGARLALGSTERPFEAGNAEFWLFSTNLAARSWLSLEGDLGYTPSQEQEPSSAVGRLGLRLRF